MAYYKFLIELNIAFSICLFSKNKVSSILIDLLGEVPEENIKFKFTSFLDKLVRIIYFVIKELYNLNSILLNIFCILDHHYQTQSEKYS